MLTRPDRTQEGAELRRLLCLLAPGMCLTVPEEWLEDTIPGPLARRTRTLEEIALDFQCVARQDLTSQTFEKLEPPATG
jgi:hypothetical protein